ncbi:MULTISPECIES: hypothetical protein [unclassified Paenibacillus]|uniref:hypothetical protein n=1 Tax=unclassified Paenibacillus TaxID=185978 RepID=UPI003645C668
MPKYAQINLDTGVCIAVSQLSGEFDDPKMILLDDNDDVSLFDTLVNGEWVKYVPPDPEPEGPSLEERYNLLEHEKALLEQRLQATESAILFLMDLA